MATVASYRSTSEYQTAWRAKRASPSEILFKALACRVAAYARNIGPESLAASYVADEQRQLFDVLMKTATAPATTNVVGWAAELVRTAVLQFYASLRPLSVFGALVDEALNVSFGNAGQVSIPGRAPGAASLGGGFVGENDAIPVSQTVLSGVILHRYKVAALSAFSGELARSGSNIEQVLRTIMAEDAAAILDGVLLDANVATSNVLLACSRARRR